MRAKRAMAVPVVAILAVAGGMAIGGCGGSLERR